MPAAPDHWRFCLAALGEASPSAGDGSSGFGAPGSIVADSFFAGPETLGTHGPDPFYFYGLVPWRFRPHRRRSRAFAAWLHETPPAEVFGPLSRATAAMAGRDAGTSAYREPLYPRPTDSLPGEPGLDLPTRFLTGLILHFLLDRAVHPWVYWNAGFSTTGKSVPAISARHARFEAALDAVPAAAVPTATGSAPEDRESSDEYPDRRTEFPIEDSVAAPSPALMLRAEREWLRAADSLFLRAFPGRYARGMYPAAYADMRSVLNFLWDPRGKKRRVFEALGLRNAMPRAMTRPVTAKERGLTDYRNGSGAPWRDPATGETRTDGLDAIVEGALSDARVALDLIAGMRSDGVDPVSPEYLELLGERNHEGCPPGMPLRYWRLGD